MLQETYRLAKENNKMLHAMRRSAFWGGLIKFIVYAVLLIAPLWFYATYLAPIMNQMLRAVQEVQGTGAKAQAQFGSFQDMLKQLQAKFPGSGSSSAR